MLTWEQWMAQNNPDVEWEGMPARFLQGYAQQYQSYRDAYTGPDPEIPPIIPPPVDPPVADPLIPELAGEPKPTQEEQDGTRSPGGEWIFSERANDWIPYTAPEPPTPPLPPPPGDDDGTVVDEDFSGELAAAVEAYRQQIREMGERERAEAQRLGARDIGKMSRMTQQALLAQGRTAGEIEQLTAGGMEAGARSLSDLIQTLNLQESRQLAGAEQFGIGTMISGEELGIRERGMAQQMAQYQQSFAEQQRQFGIGAGQWQQQFGQQASQFGQQLGLSQQQLAQQAQQYQQTFGEQQRQFGVSQPGWLDYLISGLGAAAGFFG